MNLLFKNAKICQKDGIVISDVAVSEGVIASVGRNLLEESHTTVIQLNDLYLLPGFTDVHVHLREPGFSYKETIATGTLAALKSGYTTVCTMPNLNPPPDCIDNLKAQVELIEKDARVKVVPYGCITKGQRGEGELVDFAALSSYVVGFSDDGRGVQKEELMRIAMLRAKEINKPIVAHCEDNSLLNGGYIHEGEYAKQNCHKGISSESEWAQVKRDLKLVEETGCRYHVCHISTKESVRLIREAKKKGLPVTCETAPHYLVFCDMDLKDEGRFKMNPPIRSSEDRQELIKGVVDGTIDVIATDHAPHSKEEKSKGLKNSLFGVTGLETAFPILYTHLVKTGIISLYRLLELMCRQPFSLQNVDLCVGRKADFTVMDLSKRYTIDSSTFVSMGKSTPFEGMTVYGKNIMTIIDGNIAWQGEL